MFVFYACLRRSAAIHIMSKANAKKAARGKIEMFFFFVKEIEGPAAAGEDPKARCCFSVVVVDQIFFSNPPGHARCRSVKEAKAVTFFRSLGMVIGNRYEL